MKEDFVLMTDLRNCSAEVKVSKLITFYWSCLFYSGVATQKGICRVVLTFAFCH